MFTRFRAKTSHHLVLHASGRLSAFHHVATTLVEVLHVGQAECTTAIGVALKLGDRSARVLVTGEFDNALATRATTVLLVLNLRTLDLTDRLEQLNEIVVARAPRQLCVH